MSSKPFTLHCSILTGRLYSWDIKSITFDTEEHAKQYCKMINIDTYILEGKKVTAKEDYWMHLGTFYKPRVTDVEKYIRDYIASIGGLDIEFHTKIHKHRYPLYSKVVSQSPET